MALIDTPAHAERGSDIECFGFVFRVFGSHTNVFPDGSVCVHLETRSLRQLSESDIAWLSARRRRWKTYDSGWWWSLVAAQEGGATDLYFELHPRPYVSTLDMFCGVP
ncbi:MAG: hypothetical protein JSS66_06175 [Armatimonadetes bacterium]|nr:hypothetical protein [Armatimonadota bacterium]